MCEISGNSGGRGIGWEQVREVINYQRKGSAVHIWGEEKHREGEWVFDSAVTNTF